MENKYQKIYDRSIQAPQDFWSEVAKDVFWYKKPTKILNSDNPPFYKWFEDGITNTCYNAVDLHIKNGLGERPVIKKGEARVHGHGLREHLGFYPVQLEALKALWLAIHNGVGIPLECPSDPSGELVTTVDERCKSSSFEGFVNHYNLTRRKIDCAGLDLPSMLKDIRN